MYKKPVRYGVVLTNYYYNVYKKFQRQEKKKIIKRGEEKKGEKLREKIKCHKKIQVKMVRW